MTRYIRNLFILSFLLFVYVAHSAHAQAGLYTPNPGVTERVALMDAMRAAQGVRVQYMVKYLKVFRGATVTIAGAELTPANPKNDNDALSGGIVFFQQVNGRWSAKYISGLDGATDCLSFSQAAENVIRQIEFAGAPKEVMPPQFWSDYHSAKQDIMRKNRSESYSCGNYESLF